MNSIVEKTGQICFEVRPKTEETKRIAEAMVKEANDETLKLMRKQAKYRMAVAEKTGRFAELTNRLLEVIPMSMLWSFAEGRDCWLIGMKSGIPGLDKMARWSPTARPLVFQAKRKVAQHFKDYGEKVQVKQKW